MMIVRIWSYGHISEEVMCIACFEAMERISYEHLPSPYVVEAIYGPVPFSPEPCEAGNSPKCPGW